MAFSREVTDWGDFERVSEAGASKETWDGVERISVVWDFKGVSESGGSKRLSEASVSGFGGADVTKRASEAGSCKEVCKLERSKEVSGLVGSRKSSAEGSFKEGRFSASSMA